jgi:hypothetical protein
MNNLMIARPAGWAAYRDALLAAQPTACPLCENWLASLFTTPGLNPVSVGATESVSFAIPPGFGPEAEIIIVVDGIPSDVNTTFTYDAPVIVNLAPNRANLLQLNTLNVVIDGSSFCASSACGDVLVNGAPPLNITAWSDSQITVVVPDPGSSTTPQTVQVIVGGVGSNTLSFLKPVPFFSGRTQTRAYAGMSTAGGQSLVITGVSGIGSEPVYIYIGYYPSGWLCPADPAFRKLLRCCVFLLFTIAVCYPFSSAAPFPDNGKPPSDPLATFTLTCITPPGVGARLPVILKTTGGLSPIDETFLFSYSPPTLSGSPTLIGLGNVTSPSALGRRRELQVRFSCGA